MQSFLLEIAKSLSAIINLGYLDDILGKNITMSIMLHSGTKLQNMNQVYPLIFMIMAAVGNDDISSY